MSVRKLTIAAGGALFLSILFLVLAAYPSEASGKNALIAALALSSAGLLGWCLKLSRSLKEAVEGRLNIINNIPCPVIELDSKGKVAGFNKAFSGITGYSEDEDEIAGRDFLDLMPEEQRPGFEDALKPISEGKAFTGFEAVLKLKDGRVISFEFTVLPVKSGKACFVLAGRGVGELKKMEYELEKVKAEAAEASSKLRKTINDLEQFALMAVRREKKMQEIRNHFIKLKEGRDRRE